MRACLSLIALAAGAELHLPDLQRLRTQASLAAFCSKHGVPLAVCSAYSTRPVPGCQCSPIPTCLALPPRLLHPGGLPDCRHQLLLVGDGLHLVGAQVLILYFGCCTAALIFSTCIELHVAVSCCTGKRATPTPCRCIPSLRPCCSLQHAAAVRQPAVCPAAVGAQHHCRVHTGGDASGGALPRIAGGCLARATCCSRRCGCPIPAAGPRTCRCCPRSHEAPSIDIFLYYLCCRLRCSRSWRARAPTAPWWPRWWW